MKVIPAVDIIEGKTVRLEKGRYDRKLSYDWDPVYAAREWENMGAELLHVIDLEGAREGYPVNLPILQEVTRAVNIPVQVGGGFRKETDIKKALDHGAWRVIVGSKALEEIDFARDILRIFKERVILSVDSEEGSIRIHGWEKALDLDIFEVFKRFISFGAREIIYTDIAKDGTLSGPDMKFLRRIISETNVNLIYAGGVKTIEHIRQLKELENMGLAGVIVGRALYDGTLDLKEAIDACKKDNPVS